MAVHVQSTWRPREQQATVQTWTWVGSIHGLDWVGLGRKFSSFSGFLWVGFAQLRDGVFPEEPTRVQVHSAREELVQYKALKVPAKYSQWHILGCHQWPVESLASRQVWAQSERDFSSVGLTITDARARLSAAKVEAIELVRWGLRASLISSSSWLN